MTPSFRQGSEICCEAGVSFVETPRGFGSRTSSPNDVKIIREYMSKDVLIKGAGCVRDISIRCSE